MARPAKGTPTSTNLFALREHFAGSNRASNAVAAVDKPHLRRCLKAGLFTVEGRELVLTPAGIEAVRC